jgi:membrane-bound lytic murein transglycosylase
MRISTASLALSAALAAPLITMASSPAAERDLSPEQSQALFQARKTWAKNNYQRRQELLQSQQRCIDAAAFADALNACRRQMKKARKSLKQDYQAHMNKVRNQLGLPARTGTKRDAKGMKLQG